jgi:hypothetical protein
VLVLARLFFCARTGGKEIMVKKKNRPRRVATAEQQVLAVPQTARLTGQTERAVWLDVYRGKIPHRRWGRKVIVLRSELEAFLNSLPGKRLEEVIEKIEAASEAVEKPEQEEQSLRKSAQRGTFLPTHTTLVGGDRNEHYAILSNGFDRGAMDTTFGPAPGAEMASGRAGASTVRAAAGA